MPRNPNIKKFQIILILSWPVEDILLFLIAQWNWCFPIIQDWELLWITKFYNFSPWGRIAQYQLFLVNPVTLTVRGRSGRWSLTCSYVFSISKVVVARYDLLMFSEPRSLLKGTSRGILPEGFAPVRRSLVARTPISGGGLRPTYRKKKKKKKLIHLPAESDCCTHNT